MLQLQTAKLNEKDWYHLIHCVAPRCSVSNGEHSCLFPQGGEGSTMDEGHQLSTVWCTHTEYHPSLEFVCAQAPYNMRGLLSGYIQLNFWVAYIAGNVLAYKLFEYC